VCWCGFAGAQREWNKIWRELYVKNYYKALDYQALAFKANDKKTTAVRTLVQEAEALLAEQKDRAADAVPGKPAYQLEFAMADTDVLADVARCVFSYLDTSSSFSNSDKERIGAFTRTFFPRFLALPGVAPPAGAAEAGGSDGVPAEHDSHVLYANNALYGLVRLYQVRASPRGEAMSWGWGGSCVQLLLLLCVRRAIGCVIVAATDRCVGTRAAQFAYARLHKMKQLSQETEENARLRRVHGVAKGLSLHVKTGRMLTPQQRAHTHRETYIHTCIHARPSHAFLGGGQYHLRACGCVCVRVRGDAQTSTTIRAAIMGTCST
jgi:hypothetical protein